MDQSIPDFVTELVTRDAHVALSRSLYPGTTLAAKWSSSLFNQSTHMIYILEQREHQQLSPIVVTATVQSVAEMTSCVK